MMTMVESGKVETVSQRRQSSVQQQHPYRSYTDDDDEHERDNDKKDEADKLCHNLTIHRKYLEQ